MNLLKFMFKMQTLKITLLVLLMAHNSFSQSFKNYEIKRLNMLEINTDSIARINALNYLNLQTILLKERKRKTNKAAAIALTSLSALTISFGAKIFSNSRNDKEGLGQSLGTMIIAAGIVQLGVSIPLLVSSNKRKKERDQLIELYKK